MFPTCQVPKPGWAQIAFSLRKAGLSFLSKEKLNKTPSDAFQRKTENAHVFRLSACIRALENRPQEGELEWSGASCC